jgi:hypothetical protein
MSTENREDAITQVENIPYEKKDIEMDDSMIDDVVGEITVVA